MHSPMLIFYRLQELYENRNTQRTQHVMYTSKTTQNELTRLCGDVAKQHIVHHIRQAQYFAILCDETTDTREQQQLWFLLVLCQQQA